MQSLPDAPLTAQVTPGLLPRFQDGSINMQELIRQLAESIANEVMSAEADEFCGEGNSRNGYRERSLQTCVGTLTLKVPKLRRGSFFPEDVLTRYQRVDRALAAAVAEMCATGTSTRKVQRVAERMGVGRLSKDRAGAIARDLDADVSELLSRDLLGCRTPYLWLDATYVKCRRGGRVASTAVVTAIGCDEHGWRRVLGLSVVDTESYDSWLAFLRGVRARGVDGVTLVVNGNLEATSQGKAIFQPRQCASTIQVDTASPSRAARIRSVRICGDGSGGSQDGGQPDRRDGYAQGDGRAPQLPGDGTQIRDGPACGREVLEGRRRDRGRAPCRAQRLRQIQG